MIVFGSLNFDVIRTGCIIYLQDWWMQPAAAGIVISNADSKLYFDKFCNSVMWRQNVFAFWLQISDKRFVHRKYGRYLPI